jgi:hypothetical protein
MSSFDVRGTDGITAEVENLAQPLIVTTRVPP